MTSIITIWTRGTLGRWWSSEHCFGHSIKLRVHFWTTDSSVLNLRKFKYFHWRLNLNPNIIHKSEIFRNWIRIQIICSSLISLIEIERIITSHIPAPSTDHIPIRIQENFTKHTTVATVATVALGMYLLVYLHLHISVFDKVFSFWYNDCCVTQSSKSDCPKFAPRGRREEAGGRQQGRWAPGTRQCWLCLMSRYWPNSGLSSVSAVHSAHGQYQTLHPPLQHCSTSTLQWAADPRLCVNYWLTLKICWTCNHSSCMQL